MAKTKPKNKKEKRGKRAALRQAPRPSSQMNPLPATAKTLLTKAAYTLQEGDVEGAVPLAKQALSLLDVEKLEALPALNLLGEIHVELGDIDSARQFFEQAAGIDEDGTISDEAGGGAEKFLWLAQLSEEGGQDSVNWFEKGASSLRNQIQALLESPLRSPEVEASLAEKTRKLAAALCSVIEVYMTDLSWEEDAEQKCETLVTEATMVAPSFAEPWQTLANVRLSQHRTEDAKAALSRSLDLWKDLAPADTIVPDYPTRVSLSRLLMEADMDTEALEVLERLVGEDDSSVEVWYLGGWALYIMGEKLKNRRSSSEAVDEDSWKVSWISSRQWLSHSLKLFEQQDYEDQRLGQHAKELLALLDAALGGSSADEDEEDGEDWEDDGDLEEDTDMTEA